MRRTISTGTPWEGLAGYARAVRVGQAVYVSGTTASDATGAVQHVGDAAGQARYILDKIAAALTGLDATLGDVVRTRIYVRNIADWEAVARVHGAYFGSIRPANTLVRAELVSPEHLVEIEADALIGGAG